MTERASRCTTLRRQKLTGAKRSAKRALRFEGGISWWPSVDARHPPPSPSVGVFERDEEIYHFNHVMPSHC